MKMELGVLIEHFVLRILQLGPQLLRPHRLSELDDRFPLGPREGPGVSDITDALYKQQIDALFEVGKLFSSDPISLIEFFLNYDTDIANHIEGANHLMPGTQWRICEQLCSTLCAITEQTTDFIATQIRGTNQANSGPLTPTSASSSSASAGWAFKGAEDTVGDNDLVQLRTAARQLQVTAFTATEELVKVSAPSIDPALV